MRRLPSLTALRTFECAARHAHFGRAAAELCVTDSAVRAWYTRHTSFNHCGFSRSFIAHSVNHFR